jgi:photosynthetic reaction center cytochrome c subunit
MEQNKTSKLRTASARTAPIAIALIFVYWIGLALDVTGTRPSAGAVYALGSAQAAQRPQMVEEVFKNVQVLKGISVDDFMGTMGVMSIALGYCCSDCHTNAGTVLVKWEADTPRKVMARRMAQMVQTINRDNFGGRQTVTCWTCHRGRDRPMVTPTLDFAYGTVNPDRDDVIQQAPGMPMADQIIDKYIQAIGGAQRVNAITSYAAKGMSTGFGGFGGGGQVEIYAKTPDQRATYIHFPDPERGDSTRTYDGKTGWIATPLAVLRVYELTGGELNGARLDAQLSFPGQFKQVLRNLRVGLPFTIDDKVVDVVQGEGPNGVFATLYFNQQTSLLTRVVRFSPSPIGRVPTQVDYSDYRDVNGVKMPFKFVFSWLDGRDTFELSQIQTNVPVDAGKFGKPNPLQRQ